MARGKGAQTVVAFSGGKDSTTLALIERPDVLLFTPTGDEFPEVIEHVYAVADRIGARVICPPAPTLYGLIIGFSCLPGFRKRFCTRHIKIAPAMAWMRKHGKGCRLAVGLRADEPNREELYGDGFQYVYPLRERGLNLFDVLEVLAQEKVTVPERTDCGLCFFQRLIEWWKLWKERPAHWRIGETLENWIGHTLRSPSRDSWPAGLSELRRRFESGEYPHRSATRAESSCRVCSM